MYIYLYWYTCISCFLPVCDLISRRRVWSELSIWMLLLGVRRRNRDLQVFMVSHPLHLAASKLLTDTSRDMILVSYPKKHGHRIQQTKVPMVIPSKLAGLPFVFQFVSVLWGRWQNKTSSWYIKGCFFSRWCKHCRVSYQEVENICLPQGLVLSSAWYDLPSWSGHLRRLKSSFGPSLSPSRKWLLRERVPACPLPRGNSHGQSLVVFCVHGR